VTSIVTNFWSRIDLKGKRTGKILFAISMGKNSQI